MGEFEIIAALSKLFDTKDARRVATVGIGDDAAVLKPLGGRPVWTIDASIEGVHFDRRWLSFEQIGARAFHAAVSDLAAMGATPVAALSHITVPKSVSPRELKQIAAGQAKAAAELGCPVVGGNLTSGSELGITTTALGVVKKPVLRSGARPGDSLWVMGPLGLARSGFEWLDRRGAPARGDGARAAPAAVRAAVRAWREPRALLSEGRAIAKVASAALDVSDGLTGDAGHIAEASGVCVVVEAEALSAALSPALVTTARALGLDPLRLAVEGGEDYALLFTVHEGVARGARRLDRVPDGAVRIGRIEEGRGVKLESGGRQRRVRAGFDHFAGQQ